VRTHQYRWVIAYFSGLQNLVEHGFGVLARYGAKRCHYCAVSTVHRVFRFGLRRIMVGLWAALEAREQR